jgi:VanZ family protein
MNPHPIHAAESDKAPRKGRRLPTVIAILLAVLILSTMAVIFFFSAESGEESGSRSAGVTDAILKITHPNLDSLPREEQQSIEASVHHLVRKTAHFLEYAFLAFLTTCLLLWLKHFSVFRIRPWQVWVFPAALGLLYAISDEVHQIFSHRGARVTDVLIDFAGTLFGVCMAHVAAWMLRHLRNAKRSKRGKETAL